MTTENSKPGFLSELHNAEIRNDVAKWLGPNDTLSYEGMRHILEDAAVGGMTESKFSTLETLASLLGTKDGIGTSFYVQDISRSLIDGDPANAYWTGGSATPTALGGLSATSSEGQVDKLIDKWFLGTDHPATNDLKVGGSTYEVLHGPLFGASEVPSYTDVNQGADGDCWFLATLGEVALQDPSAIKSMITNNGNGTYGVRFFVDGVADYVTVDNELPVANNGLVWKNDSALQFANGAAGQPIWAELVEKAFAELNAEPNAVHGGTTDTASNAYSGLDGGNAWNALKEITGQHSITYWDTQLVGDVKTIGAAFEAGEELMIGFDKLPEGYKGNLVADHVMEIIGYDAGSQSFEIHNQWGSANETAKAMTFTMSVQDLANDGASITVAQGTAHGLPTLA